MSSLAYSIPSIVILIFCNTATRIIRYPLWASVRCTQETSEVNIRPPVRIHRRNNGTLVLVFTMNRDPSTTSSDSSASNAWINLSISHTSCWPSASNVTRYSQPFSVPFCRIYSSPVSSAAQAPRLVIWWTKWTLFHFIRSCKSPCVPSVDPSSTTRIWVYHASTIPSITPRIRVASL